LIGEYAACEKPDYGVRDPVAAGNGADVPRRNTIRRERSGPCCLWSYTAFHSSLAALGVFAFRCGAFRG
jgi:hypothetical protein